MSFFEVLKMLDSDCRKTYSDVNGVDAMSLVVAVLENVVDDAARIRVAFDV